LRENGEICNKQLDVCVHPPQMLLLVDEWLLK